MFSEASGATPAGHSISRKSLLYRGTPERASLACMPPMIVTISPAAFGFSLDSATFLRLVAGGVPLRADARA